MRKRVIAATRSRALAAMIAQVWQAVTSFGLQVLAAWMLGAAGLGTFSLCLGVIVLAAAVASGLVGDSLVVLDRHDRRVRGGLQFWTVVLAVVSVVGTSSAMGISGVLTLDQAVLFGVSLLAFQLKEIVRRIFTATMRFWPLVVIDSSALVISLAAVGLWALLGPVSLTTFLVAVAVGQSVGLVVAIGMLPAAERGLVSLRGSGIRSVFSFGVWRGAQVAIPQLLLTVMRITITVAAGAAVLGQIEAARIYVAPAMLAVQGLGAYLLSSYVRDRETDVSLLFRRATRVSLAMIGAATVAGVLLVLAAPILAQLVTGPSFSVDRIAVAGWALCVVATAANQPFASLAATRGRQAAVFAFRGADACLAALTIWLLVVVAGVSPSWAPFALAGGLLISGTCVRQLIVKPLVRTHSVQTAELEPRKSYAAN